MVDRALLWIILAGKKEKREREGRILEGMGSEVWAGGLCLCSIVDILSIHTFPLVAS